MDKKPDERDERDHDRREGIQAQREGNLQRTYAHPGVERLDKGAFAFEAREFGTREEPPAQKQHPQKRKPDGSHTYPSDRTLRESASKKAVYESAQQWKQKNGVDRHG